MDCRNCVFLYKENVWRICLFCQTEKYDTGNDAKNIIVQQNNFYLDKTDSKIRDFKNHATEQQKL